MQKDGRRKLELVMNKRDIGIVEWRNIEIYLEHIVQGKQQQLKNNKLTVRERVGVEKKLKEIKLELENN